MPATEDEIKRDSRWLMNRALYARIAYGKLPPRESDAGPDYKEGEDDGDAGSSDDRKT